MILNRFRELIMAAAGGSGSGSSRPGNSKGSARMSALSYSLTMDEGGLN
jgi:hypothetical protein